jgi:Domain of unknown function (DUF5753)
MVWSLSKMIRIENAASSISINDLRVLMQLYGITDERQAADLEGLAREARKRSWWRSYSNVAPSTLIELIDYESAASSVRQFETMFVPGILQTEEYARTVLQNYYDKRPTSELAALVDLRTRREDLLNREGAPQFTFILDEPVIRRLVGGSAVMRRQLERLAEVAQLPNITIEIVPFSAGLHPGTKGPFEIVEFADAVGEFVVFLESARGDVISDKLEETQSYGEAFERIREKSLGPDGTIDFLKDAVKAMP